MERCLNSKKIPKQGAVNTTALCFLRPMRYHYAQPEYYSTMYGQRYESGTKNTWWSDIDPWLTDAIYLNPGFRAYFKAHAGAPDGLYPTVTVRQIMWAPKMKPIPKERWETVFDRADI